MKYALVLIFIISALEAPAEGKTLYFGTAWEPPISHHLQTGMADLIVKEAFARIGIKVVILLLPAERSLIKADRGINDGDLVRVGGLQRVYPNLLQVPEKLVELEFVGFTKHIRMRPAGWKSLAPYQVGIVTGWKILEENIDSSRLTTVQNRTLLFTLLVNDRADIVMYERLTGYGAVASMKLSGVYALDPPFVVTPGFLYLHKRHRALVPLVAASLRKMKEDGSHAGIVESTMKKMTDQVKKWPE